ncbi:MAG: M48 family metallopeptidase [Candidatus Aenigmatarchaeota archaeon]
MKVSLFDQIQRNKRNSLFLVIFVFLILTLLVYVISLALAPGLSIILVIIGFILIISHIYYSYNHGDKVVLKAVNAKPADERKHRYLIDTVEGLAIAAGIPKPKVYVIENKELNAFATGKDPKHASIAVTTGLIEKLNRSELEGVIGHEMSHIRNYDIRFATLVAVLVGLAAIISYMFLRGFRVRSSRKGGWIILIAILFAIIAPIATRLVQAAISRRREYLADAGGAELTRYPPGLANALKKLKKYNKGKMKVSEAISHLFFIDPSHSPLDSLFATHPPIDKRIEILRSM